MGCKILFYMDLFVFIFRFWFRYTDNLVTRSTLICKLLFIVKSGHTENILIYNLIEHNLCAIGNAKHIENILKNKK